MDIFPYLERRLDLAIFFYKNATQPFREMIISIENELEPFCPKYDEDGRPLFYDSWKQCKDSMSIVEGTSISLISEAIKLYFSTWEKELDYDYGKFFKDYPKNRRGSWLENYKRMFGDLIGTDWHDCPVDFEIIEQLILARNSAQHPKDISDSRSRHDPKTFEKFPIPFFAIPLPQDSPPSFGISCSLFNSKEQKMERAVKETRALCSWMEDRLFVVKYKRHHPQQPDS